MTQTADPKQNFTQNLDVLIVGAGFAGLYMLHKVREMGLRAQVVEAASGVGGTWFHNCYPGARVDIQSMEYSLSFSEALQQEWKWTERYAGQPELLRYANHVAERFGLFDGIQFNTRVTGANFDEVAHRWLVSAEPSEFSEASAASTKSNQWSAQFLVLASGPLSSPNVPDFPGLKNFKGRVFHTARWPKESVDFTGQRVGLIGTGSSGVQSIPVIAKQAKHLTVFQRTPAYAVPAHNGPLDPVFEARIKGDYAGFRQRNLAMAGGFSSELPPNQALAHSATAEERQDAFEARWKVGGFSLLGTYRDIMLDERANALAAEFVRGKIRQAVRDPKIAELLCPTHTIGCKRLCVDTGYYETYNRENVQLVDISQHPIESVTPQGLTVNGQAYEFDALILATGFDAMTGTLMRLDLKGRDGLSIQEKWKTGPRNYLGLTINGFPNLFSIAGAGSTSAFTVVTVSIEHHVQWIARCIADLKAMGKQSIEATPEAEADYIEHVNKVAERTVYLTCNSWYLGANIPGKSRMFMPLVGFPPYAKKCAEVVERGYEGFLLRG